jgi:hypothetical protein
MLLENANDFVIGERLTAIVLGMDDLRERDAELYASAGFDHFVPIFIGRATANRRAYADWQEAESELAALARDVDQLADGSRKTFLAAMVRSQRAAVRMIGGETLSFAEKLREFAGVPAGLVPEETLDELRERLSALLATRGYASGPLGDRVRAWERARVVPVDDLGRVFDELMDVARARTDAAIFPVGDYAMRLRPVRDVRYTARCSFDDGCMDINVDVAFTRSNLKHLVCHEVFPGHATQLLYTRALVDAGRAPVDTLLCTANAVTGCVQEGIGDQGIELIDWVEDEDDAAHIELRRLQTAAGANAAWHLMVSGWPEERAAAYLRDRAFGQDAWVAGRIGFARQPFHGPFLAHYWYGNETVRAVRLRAEAAGPVARTAFVTYLYERLHSPESLDMFAPAA